jgi:endogenous inhibitor of DNA gyrase (YacG/DUF329 family)
MTVREAMDIINGALDSLYEFYDNDADSVFEDISKAEAVLEKLVQKEEKKPEEYWAECPDCGHELHYDTFEYDDYDEDVVTFLASGYCPHCQKDFLWKENFELIDIEYDED